jgi:hypothetical protein
MLGRLKVSHRAVVWMAGSGKLGYSIAWQRLDRLMQDGGRKLRLTQ